MQALTVGFLLAAAIAYAAYLRGSLSRSGAVAAALVGGVVMGAGGAGAGVALLGFFLTSTALSHHRLPEKLRAAGDKFAKGERRDAAQVLANGGAAAALCLLYRATGGPLWLAGALASLAAAAGDTWATEIGVLARGRPRLLLTWEPAETGTSGAVSAQGLLGMAAGALLIAALAALLPPGGLRLGAVVWLGGVAGAMLDSVLGAAVQERRACLRCGAATEQQVHACGGQTRRAGGVAGLDNDWVNALSTAAGGAAGALLWLTLC